MSREIFGANLGPRREPALRMLEEAFSGRPSAEEAWHVLADLFEDEGALRTAEEMRKIWWGRDEHQRRLLQNMLFPRVRSFLMGLPYGLIRPARKVKLLVPTWSVKDKSYRAGRIRYAEAYNTRGGFITETGRPSRPGEIVYLVTASSHGRGGGTWWSEDGLEFRGKPPVLW